MDPRAVCLVAVMLGACAATPGPKAFHSDGCSLFPDGTAHGAAGWSACCVAHDLHYWRGGSAAQRRRADTALRACVASTGRPVLATLMYRGVRLGGTPLLPSPFRWGYGWPYGRGYAVLSDEEQRRLDEQFAIGIFARPASTCTSPSE